MEREEIRLECLSIVREGRPHIDSGQLVQEAKILEAWVTEKFPTQDKPLLRKVSAKAN